MSDEPEVVWADDCEPCEMCGEPICPHCKIHYADCPCPGPMSEMNEEEDEQPEPPASCG